MELVILNDQLHLNLPEGFRVLREEERKAMATIDEPPAWCVRNEERHLVISAYWRKIGMLPALLINEKDIIRNVEQTIAKPMAQYGYHLENWESILIGDRKAQGICYSYHAEGIGMVADSFVVKSRRALYYFHTYSRSALHEENRILWSDLFLRATWND